MKPIVGVMPLWDKEKDSLWMLPGYLDGISQAGGIPIVFPFNGRTGTKAAHEDVRWFSVYRRA